MIPALHVFCLLMTEAHFRTFFHLPRMHAQICWDDNTGEAIGMALLEAQAAGLAVVAGNVGAIGTIVLHGETGFLVPEGDARAFRKAVAEFLDLPIQKRAAFAKLALAKTETLHDINDLGAGHLGDLLQSAVDRASGRQPTERPGAQ